MTRRASGTLPADVNPDSLVAEDQLPGEKANADMSRGGKNWYVDLRELRRADNPIVHLIRRKPAEFRRSAGLDTDVKSVAEALKEHGDDTSQ